MATIPAFADTIQVSNDEMATMQKWSAKFSQKTETMLPFSFIYDGKSSADLLPGWKCSRKSRKLDGKRIEHTSLWLDPKTSLVVRCFAVEYSDFPVIEWTVFFENNGKSDTPIIENIQALDASFARESNTEKTLYFLNHYTGSPANEHDYEPHKTAFAPKTQKRLSAFLGRPTNSDLCFFNFEFKDEGMIIGIGWGGQWSAEFTRDEMTTVSIRIKQELTHFTLHPGEEVRTPLIALLFYKGEYLRSQNLWRRWMIAHNLPRPGGKLPFVPQFTACSSFQFGEMINANEANQKLFIDRYIEEGLKPDYWWMDAGWYINDGGWQNTGTWEVDTKRFPNGLKAISDYARNKKIRTLVWFEPERVTPNTRLFNEHPEWLLKVPSDCPNEWIKEHDWRLLNLGNPDARKWLIEHVSKTIKEQGIDLYRQDFNYDPLLVWRANDAENRQGITENHYVTGYLSYWDELRKIFPNMLIDSCASGGRRNDLETLRRSVPLWRTDHVFEPVSQQCHTYGISFWMPFSGTGTKDANEYVFWSNIGPAVNTCWDLREKNLNYELLRRLIAEWKSIALYYYGDYYPLTNYSLANDVWMMWQFDRPDLGEGMVQAFRRAESPYETARIILKGLNPAATYEIMNLDEKEKRKICGKELIKDGLQINIKVKPATIIIKYQTSKPQE